VKNLIIVVISLILVEVAISSTDVDDSKNKAQSLETISTKSLKSRFKSNTFELESVAIFENSMRSDSGQELKGKGFGVKGARIFHFDDSNFSSSTGISINYTNLNKNDLVALFSKKRILDIGISQDIAFNINFFSGIIRPVIEGEYARGDLKYEYSSLFNSSYRQRSKYHRYSVAAGMQLPILSSLSINFKYQLSKIRFDQNSIIKSSNVATSAAGGTDGEIERNWTSKAMLLALGVWF